MLDRDSNFVRCEYLKLVGVFGKDQLQAVASISFHRPIAGFNYGTQPRGLNTGRRSIRVSTSIC